MSKFTKQFTRTYEFDGDFVTVTMNRLKRKDAVKLAPFLPEPDSEGKYIFNTQQGFEFMDKAGEILGKYVTHIEGLKDGEGVPVPRELLFGNEDEAEAYFMPLLGEMMGDLMEASFVSDEETKKSSGV
jgi:hypothetical protein